MRIKALIAVSAVEHLHYATPTDKLRLLCYLPTGRRANLACQARNQAEAGDVTEWLNNGMELGPQIRELILIAHACQTDCVH